MILSVVPYLCTSEKVLADLDVSVETGLAKAEVVRRQGLVGPNTLRETKPQSVFKLIGNQFKSSVVALLVVAAVLSILFGELSDAVAIAAVIVVNTAIGFFTEMSATRSMEALFKLDRVDARVRRDGGIEQIPSTELVPGDLVILEAGDLIPADVRFVATANLQVDESPLTGESTPNAKHTEPVVGEPILADRLNMGYKGTSVTRGTGEAVVTATAMETEIGAISSLVETAEDSVTPLEKRLNSLGRNLVWVILGITVFITLLGILRGKDVFVMIEMGIALAVASIPEGLPIVATIALSRGLLRMSRRQALVRQLSSVETLGSATIIFTDKTGTLTENRLTVTRIEVTEDRVERTESGGWEFSNGKSSPGSDSAMYEALKIGCLCNNASIRESDEDGDGIGDPLEVALLDAGVQTGVTPAQLSEDFPKVREEPFESETKMMATYHRCDSEVYVAVKGAPETILDVSDRVLDPAGVHALLDDTRAYWCARNEAIASEGFRVLAVAYKMASSIEGNPFEELVFVGLLGFLDPPREDIRESLGYCRAAGVRVIMLTGDQAVTARYVGRAVGITESEEESVVSGDEFSFEEKRTPEEEARIAAANLFARVGPKQKLDLVALHQGRGAVVAMMGDGVNDAPALKKADIGVAMGQRGTQVAREVADVVLKDDSFRTIVYAIEEGRVIYGNIRKFVLYLLSCNIAEILVVFLAALVNSPLPVLPLQILFLNLVTDVFPALALGVGEGDGRVMQRAPRPPGEPILARRHWLLIVAYGSCIALSTLGAFFIARVHLDVSEQTAVTMAFMTLAISQLLHVFNMRDPGGSVFRNEVVRNRYVWGALLLCVGLLSLALYAPLLSTALKTGPLSLEQWLVVLGMSAIPVTVDLLARPLRARWNL